METTSHLHTLAVTDINSTPDGAVYEHVQSNFTDPRIRCRGWSDEECELFESGYDCSPKDVIKKNLVQDIRVLTTPFPASDQTKILRQSENNFEFDKAFAAMVTKDMKMPSWATYKIHCAAATSKGYLWVQYKSVQCRPLMLWINKDFSDEGRHAPPQGKEWHNTFPPDEKHFASNVSRTRGMAMSGTVVDAEDIAAWDKNGVSNFARWDRYGPFNFMQGENTFTVRTHATIGLIPHLQVST